jgi:hypothetical protein
MMDDTNPFLPRAAFPPAETPSGPSPSPTPAQSPGLSPEAPAQTPAGEKFKSCRWRATPDVGEFCTHRDVLPFAGKEGFVAESWCPECAFYKLRRTPKKRERVDFSY